MYEEYDKPLHAPPPWKTMADKGQDLNEAEVDAAIAGILSAAEPPLPKVTPTELREELVDVDLSLHEAAEDEAETPVVGFTQVLRQKWAELCGAA